MNIYSGVKRVLKKVSILVWLFACVSIISGCSKNPEGTVYLTGSSIIKLTIDSGNGTKEASALNKAGEALLANLAWKGEPEEAVLDSLIQGMQEEDVKQIYVEILGEEKDWENAELQKLSEYFSADRYESRIQIEVRRVVDLDAVGTGGQLQVVNDSERSLEIGKGNTPSTLPEESLQSEEAPQPVESPQSEEASQPVESPQSEESSIPEKPSPEERPTVRETRPASETEGRTAAVLETTVATETPEEIPEETLPLETPETESSREKLPEEPMTQEPDVYIPTGKIEEEVPFGPGW